MLQIVIPATESYDEVLEEFVNSKEQVLQLEHSLVSLSKWESKWKKPFLTKINKTYEESIDYIRCMTLTQNVDPSIYIHITHDNIREVNEYIEDSMTATTFSVEETKAQSNQINTAEIIYYWMIALNIPFECQKWHLNRLLTLIRVCSITNAPPKKMGRNSVLSRNAQINAARKKQLNTRG